MTIASIAGLAPRAWRRVLAALVPAAMALLAPAVLAQDVNVTEIRVRFRDAVANADYASAPTAEQFATLGARLHTGIASWTPTIDGGFVVALAPALPFLAAREAITRLRLDDSVLYATLAATDAPTPPPAVRAKRGDSGPPLSRIVVRYREPRLAADAAANAPLATAQLDAIAAIAGQPVVHERTMDWARAYIVRLFAALPVDQAEALAARIAQEPDVLWAQPDYIDTFQFVPNDPMYNNPGAGNVQWHYFEAAGGVNLPTAWDKTRGWSGARAAVVDTGALFGHPDLGARFIGGYDFIVNVGAVNSNDGNDRDPDASDPGDWIAAFQCGSNGAQDSSWHGTHVAGTVGAITNNGVGVSGINHVARIVPVRVLGMCGGFSTDIADGIVWAAGGAIAGVPANPHPAKAINVSIGGRRANQTCDAVYQTMVTTIGTAASVIVSAGNSNEDATFSTPANCAGVVTVAATGRQGQRASYSNYDAAGGGVQVEIAAPGGSMSTDGELGVLSTLNAGATVPAAHNYEQYHGTSMAAPHVTGIVSLMYALKPSLTPSQVLAHITSTARAFPVSAIDRRCTNNIALATGPTRYCGAGIIDANAALTQVLATGNGGGAMAVATATLGSSANPSNSGTPVTFTAQVTSAVAPNGTVAFTENDVVLPGCAAVPLAGAGTTRTAQCVANLTAGTHPIRAAFAPSSTATTPADSAVLSQVVSAVGGSPTTTTLTSSVNPSVQGASVTFTASVNGVAPTGTVQFRSNGVAIGGCNAVALTGAGDTRTAQCATSALPAGLLAIEANYSGNATNAPSTGSMPQGVSGPNACVVFNDVTNADPFCGNVQWIYNRGITLGCTLVEYCPNSPVTRLAMAAFMNRQGAALTPVDLPVATHDVGGMNLASATVVCDSDDYTPTGFPRRAVVRARSNLWGPTASMDVSAELVVSTNGGATWTPIPNTLAFQSLYSGLTPGDDRTTTMYGEVDLATGVAHRFGLRLQRAVGSGNVGVYCASFVQVRNRN